MRMNRLASLAGLMALSSCQTAAAGAPAADCPIIGSSDWAARVDAMPGPGSHPKLIVTGKVQVPTGGYRLALRLGPVAESYPVQVTIILDAVRPAGPAAQAIVTHDVNGSWPVAPPIGSMTIRCGRQVIGRVDEIVTAL
jgi:hypothetical protein